MYTVNEYVKCPCCGKNIMVNIQYDLPPIPSVRKIYDISQTSDNNNINEVKKNE